MSRNFKVRSFFVDEVLDEREKSWHVRLGETKAFLAKSNCERDGELEFTAPSWLVKKILEAADRKLIKAA